jgi:sortase A
MRTLARGFGQTMMTFGFVVLLLLVYEVWVSNYFAERKQEGVRKDLVTAWNKGQDPLHGEDRLSLPSGKQVIIPAGKGFANLYIPRLGKDYAETVVQGTDDTSLERGPGHYPDTQLPGQVGNFAMAGHRVGKGQPFLNLDQLKPGDALVFQTASSWYVYRVLGESKTGDLSVPDAQGVAGREIVSPNAGDVIDPVPNKPGAKPVRALVTLTTCHPKYSANQRMIIHGVLDRAISNQGKATPKELVGGTI